MHILKGVQHELLILPILFTFENQMLGIPSRVEFHFLSKMCMLLPLQVIESQKNENNIISSSTNRPFP